MNTLPSLLALCCLCGLTTAYLWQSSPNTRRDCQWMAWRTTGRCENYGWLVQGMLRIEKVRDKIPARNGGMDCVGLNIGYDDCNETQYVASTFLDTINSQSRGDYYDVPHAAAARINPCSAHHEEANYEYYAKLCEAMKRPFPYAEVYDESLKKKTRVKRANKLKPPKFNPCTKPYLDASNNPRMLGKPCETRKRRRRSADGNIEVYEEQLKERIRVKTQTTTLSTKHRDILFLIDESSSVGPHNFKKEVRLAKAIVNNWCGAIKVGKHRTRVGILGFDEEQHPMLDFDQLFEKSQILTHMDNNVMYTTSTHGSTCLYDALEFTRTNMMSSGRGARKDNSNTEQVVVLITDGCANCKDQGDLPTLLENARIKFDRAKIPIIAFFIGNLELTCKAKMQGLANGAQCYQLFSTPNWTALDVMSEGIEGMECTDSWKMGPPCPQ